MTTLTIGVFRLCADKIILCRAATKFQPLIEQHFVSFCTILTIDPEEP